MKFDVISIAYIVIFVIFVLIGLKKGFFKTLLSLAKSILSLVASIFLTIPLTKFLCKSQVGIFIGDKISTNLTAKDAIFQTIVTESNKTEVVNAGLKKLNISDTISSLLSKFISNKIEANGETLASSIGTALTYYILIIVSFILIYIVIYLLTFILNKVFDSFTSFSIGKFLDKLLGVAIFTVFALFVICLISYGIVALVSVGGSLSDWLTNTICLNTDEITISKFVYMNNPIEKIISYILSKFV